MLNPIHLRTLCEVVRQGTFVGAANRLGYTPSAVSQQMAALEGEAGLELFDRSARSIRPNGSAIVMAQQAAGVLASMDAMLAATAESRGRNDTARLSMFPSLAAQLMPRLLADPALAEHGLDLSISVHDPSLTIRELRTHPGIDVAIVYRMGGTGLFWPTAYEPVYLASDPFVVIAPADWALRSTGRSTAAALVDRPWIMHHSASGDAEVIDELFAAHGVRPRIVGRCDDYAATIALVAGGMGAAFVPDFIARDLPCDVETVVVDDLPMQRDIFALVCTTSPTERITALMASIHAALPSIGYPAAPEDQLPIEASLASSSAVIADSMMGSSAPSIT